MVKAESRILVLTQPLRGIHIGIVLRGAIGIENVLPIYRCHEIAEFLAARRGIAGEIRYVYLANDVDETCRALFKDLEHKNLIKIVSENELPTKLSKRVEEAITVARLILYRFITAVRDDRGFKS